MDDIARGAGWLTFAGIMVLIAGILNVIWGIAAIDSPAYPFWSLAIFGLDLLIIYGLSAYGGQRSRAATG
jgi:hypothetical protein